MFTHRLPCVLLLVHSLYCQSGIEETIAYLESLLARNRNIAIILIDMQTGYMPTFLENSSFMDMVENQKSIIKAMAGKKGVYFVDVNTVRNMGPTISELLTHAKYILKRGLVLKSVDNAFNPESAKYVEHIEVVGSNAEEYKYKISLDLDTFLKNAKVNDLLITGCFSGLCVYETTKSALEQGYSVIVDQSINVVFNKNAVFFGPGTEIPYALQLQLTQDSWKNLAIEYPDNSQVFNKETLHPCDN